MTTAEKILNVRLPKVNLPQGKRSKLSMPNTVTEAAVLIIRVQHVARL